MPRRIGILAAFSLSCLTSPLCAAPIQLTHSPGADRHPTWSLDDSFIIFESNRDGHAWHLYRVPSTGGPDTQITFSQGSQLAPEISPDGTRIAFLEGSVAVEEGDIFSSGLSVMPVTGGVPTVLVPNDGWKRWHPTWSPDGTTIYFTRGVPSVGEWDIYRVSASGGSETFVLDLGDDFSEAISPDGRSICWGSHPPDAPYNLMLGSLSSTQFEALTFEGANTGQPDFSPDGEHLVCASRKIMNRLELFQLDLASKNMTRLTFDAEGSPFDPLSQYPEYSRNGQNIAFSSARIDGNENIWVLPLETASLPVICPGDLQVAKQ
jgi:Tol biopolymer transport system component